MIRTRRAVLLLTTTALLSCTGVRPIWHDQLLPSGRQVKVTSFHLVWGVEHDERDAGKDSLALEFVSADPSADPAGREREALEVFELIRPTSELWGFATANVSSFPSVERKGRYEIFTFSRGAAGAWSVAHQSAKVFSTDP